MSTTITDRIQSIPLEKLVAAYNAAKQSVNHIYEIYWLTGGAAAVDFSELCEIRDAIRHELEASKQVQFDDEGNASLTNGLPEIC